MESDVDVVEDLRVASVAAGCTVALTLLLRFVLRAEVGLLVRLSPLAVYFAYLVFGTGDTGSRIEDARLWIALIVALTLGVLAVSV